MRKFIFVSVLIIIAISVSLMIIGIVSKVRSQKITAERIDKLPYFSFLTLSNVRFNSIDIKEGPVLIVHFHPECEHCQYEISEILRSDIPKSFGKVILVSGAHPDSIKTFLNQFNCSFYPSVIALIDTSSCFKDIFGSGIIPSSYIYSTKLELIKNLVGEVKTDAILKFLQEGEQDK